MSESRRQRAGLSARPLFWVLLAALAAGGWWWLRAARRPAPSVLLVTIDTLRADALSTEDTPALLDLAARGTRFLRARAPAPITLPAHATLLSGLWPTRHGLRDNTSPPLPADRNFPLLAEQFAAAGYDTAAFVASAVLGRRYGLDAGFREYREPASQDKGAPEFVSLDADEQVARFLAWWDAKPADRPYFAWVHLWEPHAPYREYAGDARRAGTDASDPAALRYRGEVRKADAALEALLARIDPERTIVIVVADHGESLGEHGEATHAYLCHGATMDVPLVVAGPGIPAAREETDVAALADLAPTLRRLCGLPDRDTDGEDLFALPDDRVVPGESLYAYRRYRWAQQTVATDGRFTLIDGGKRWSLYDRASDPDEMRPLPDAEQREVYERLDKALAAYRRSGAAGGGDPLGRAGSPYGATTIPEATLLAPEANSRRFPVQDGWARVALLNRAEALLALARAGRDAKPLRAVLADLERLERDDPDNPAPCLLRGRALFFVFREPKAAAAALWKAFERGYTGPDVVRLLRGVLEAAGDAEGLARLDRLAGS
jgi:arylsulfatase A-like enzyme